MNDAPASDGVAARAVFYFDGTSSRRHAVTIGFADRLEIVEDGETLAVWSYADIRRADGPTGTLRATCLTALPLARLEIRDRAIATDLIARCARLEESARGHRGVGAIVGWSLAAAISIVLVVLYGVPLAADRLAPLVPQALERRLGDVADRQIRALFGGKVATIRRARLPSSSL